jgi:hypothetical protein
MPYISPTRIRAIQAARNFTGLPVTPRFRQTRSDISQQMALDESREAGNVLTAAAGLRNAGRPVGYVSPPTTAEAAYEQLGMKLVAYAGGQYHAAPSTPSVRYIKRKHVSVH